MFQRIKDSIAIGITPLRPRKLALIVMPIAIAFTLLPNILSSIFAHSINVHSVIAGLMTSISYLICWLILLKNKQSSLSADTKNKLILSLMLCLMCEISFVVIGIVSAASGLTPVTFDSVFTMIVNVIAASLYAYSLYYYIKIDGSPEYNEETARKSRIVLCIHFAAILFIYVMQGLCSLALNKMSIPHLLLVPFVTVLTLFIMYYPWLLFMASTQYCDSAVSARAKRRSEKKTRKAKKQEERRELYRSLHSAMNGSYEPTQSPLQRRKRR